MYSISSHFQQFGEFDTVWNFRPPKARTSSKCGGLIPFTLITGDHLVEEYLPSVNNDVKPSKKIWRNGRLEGIMPYSNVRVYITRDGKLKFGACTETYTLEKIEDGKRVFLHQGSGVHPDKRVIIDESAHQVYVAAWENWRCEWQ